MALRGRSLDAVLSFDSQATRQERGLIRALSYDSIRWYLRLNALLERLLARPGQKLEPDVLIPMHCSGLNFLLEARAQMPGSVINTSTGSKLIFSA